MQVSLKRILAQNSYGSEKTSHLLEPPTFLIAIYRPAALSTLWDMNGVRGAIQNNLTVHLLAHGNAEERDQAFWKDHVSYTNKQFEAKTREVPTESLAAELHSLVAECVRSLTSEDHCQIAGVNGSIPALLAAEYQSSSIKNQVPSAATNDQQSLGAKEQSAAPLGENMGLSAKARTDAEERIIEKEAKEAWIASFARNNDSKIAHIATSEPFFASPESFFSCFFFFSRRQFG